MTFGASKSSCTGRGDEIEQPRRNFRVLDVERKGFGAGEALDGERDGHAPPADGDDRDAARGLRAARSPRRNGAGAPAAPAVAGQPERSRMAPVTRTRFRLNGRPTASATAMPCASMPTDPSVMIQVFSPRAFRLVAMRAAASSGAGALVRFFGEDDLGPLKLPERITLNFFSILLAGGPKIAQTRLAGESRSPAF